VIVNFLSNAVKFSPIGSQIVIQMTEGETRPGVPVAPRSVAERDARDAKDKKKKSMWSRVSMSQSPERSAEGTFVVQCRVCLRYLSQLPCLASKYTAATSIAQLHTSLLRSHIYLYCNVPQHFLIKRSVLSSSV
jgi:hypothetical protein